MLQKRVTKVGADVRLQALIQWSGMPSSLATWEDMETLRQVFPRTPAWGQVGSYRGGDVSTRTTTSATQEDNGNDDGQPDVHGDIQAEHGPRRGGRDRRPNIRVHGPEWK